MSRKEGKRYVCVHMDDGCFFEATKRKSIMTHLLRTHNERKEDFECEYCDSLFHDETEIDKHLFDVHAGLPFRYTCVSRIENVINKCAKLGAGQQAAALKTTDDNSPTVNMVNETGVNSKMDMKDLVGDGLTQNWDSDASNSSNGRKHGSKRSKSETRKLAVNESLNNIAKLPKIAVPENPYIAIKREVLVDTPETEASSAEFISKPSGLKIKLNLKNIAKASTGESFSDHGSKVSSQKRVMDADDPQNSLEDKLADSPDEPVSPTCTTMEYTTVIREHGTKYFDREEVYHTIDAQGRRCCPFCNYTTTKNTIRVHLSGMHKIYFVQCSLCDYKAAFPHQVTQHGLRFHKLKDIQVNQLSKEYREKIIAELCKYETSESQQPVLAPKPLSQQRSSPRSSIHEVTSESDYVIDDMSDQDFEALLDDDGVTHRKSPSGGKKTFKAPKCQTSKTDYYSIEYEDGVYLYSCKLCTFQTPVRATIYTHKYRHEENSYKCGHCDYTSHPRSNVAHHIRSKHKGCEIIVEELADSATKDDSHTPDSKHPESVNGGPTGKSPMADTSTGKTNDAYIPQCAIKQEPGVNIKKEPVDPSDADVDHHLTSLSGTPQSHQEYTPSTYRSEPTETVNKKTIIKVPQYKRMLSPNSNGILPPPHPSVIRKAIQTGKDGTTEYKMSLNKMYRINPHASPRFMCNDCSYACDTHPKMKHHLYSHRPQRYQCPYCDHRKYPRSYVLRHVRDTHRGKPITVVDLGPDKAVELDGRKPGEVPPSAECGSDVNGGEKDAPMEYTDDSFTDDLEESMRRYIEQEVSQLPDETQTINGSNTDPNHCTIKMEPIDEYNADTDNLKQTELIKHLSPNATPPMSSSESHLRTALTTNNASIKSSSPNSGKVKGSEKKKSLRDYRINSGKSPRYVCNVCAYGTDNYKTIHNHMYRHESQRFQCPYCGYRRSPRSFVENHIREVHKGQPVIVTELDSNLDGQHPEGSPRQCNMKRKDQSNSSSRPAPPVKRPCTESVQDPASSKLSIKWPAPKPASKVNMVSHPGQAAPPSDSPPPPQLSPVAPIISVPTLQIPMKQKTSSSSISRGIPSLHVPSRPTATMPNLSGLLKQPSPQTHGSHVPQTSPQLHVSHSLQQSPSNRISPKVSPTSLPPAKQLPQIISNLHQRQAALLSSKNTSGAVNKKSPISTPKPPPTPPPTPPPPPKSPTVAPVYKEYHEGSRTTFKTMYKCVFDPETCNHISKDKSKMKQHLFMHVEYKPWTCELCDVTASQSSHVKHHIRIEHPDAEVSYKYKRHNYLEKHIETFLTKGLFTVPVNEYRLIMDMKGHTKKQNQPTFRRDHEGFILCPHCDYRTKSGGMTDHVKMKHFQPRFKCHWCDYRAFYKSEVRKHHRKERNHMDLEFKTQELDLSQVMGEIREGEDPRYVASQQDSAGINTDQGAEPADVTMEDTYTAPSVGVEMEHDENSKDYDDDDVDDMSSVDSNSTDNSAHGNAFDTDLSYGSSLTESTEHKPMDINVMAGFSIKLEEFNQMRERIAELKYQGNTNTNTHEIDKCDKTTENMKVTEKTNTNFKCGYCPFSAKLRMKVKMHCQKRHSGKNMYVIDPVSKRQLSKPISDDVPIKTVQSENVLNVEDFIGKGTKFEQDLKRAGVCTLNLDSLFPKTTINLNHDATPFVNEVSQVKSDYSVRKNNQANKESIVSPDIQKEDKNFMDDSIFKKPSCIQPLVKDKVGRYKSNGQTDLVEKHQAERVHNNLNTDTPDTNETCSENDEAEKPLTDVTLETKVKIDTFDIPPVNDQTSVDTSEMAQIANVICDNDMAGQVQENSETPPTITNETQLIVQNNETGTTMTLDIPLESSNAPSECGDVGGDNNETALDTESNEVLDKETTSVNVDKQLPVSCVVINKNAPEIEDKSDDDSCIGDFNNSMESENNSTECVHNTVDRVVTNIADSKQKLQTLDVEMDDNSNEMHISEDNSTTETLSDIDNCDAMVCPKGSPENADKCSEVGDSLLTIDALDVATLNSDQPNDLFETTRDHVKNTEFGDDSNSYNEKWNAEGDPPDIVISPLNIQTADSEHAYNGEIKSDSENSQNEALVFVNEFEILDPPALSPAIHFDNDKENILAHNNIMDTGSCGDIGIVGQNNITEHECGDSVSSESMSDHSENSVCNGEQVKLSSFCPMNVETA